MTHAPTLDDVRAHACRMTFITPTTLAGAITRLGFVQADPIRAPARAQDLILRHRVKGYRVGDLERGFSRLKLEEDFLYAYGFMPPDTRDLLHPRWDPNGEAGVHAPTGLAAEVLAFVRANGATHPKDLEAQFGRDRAVNGWGGFSKATTRALENLHHYGLLRVAQRRDGIRIYQSAPPRRPGRMERTRPLIMLVARLLAPVSPTALRSALALMARRNPGLDCGPNAVTAALKDGELIGADVGGETYLWPAETIPAADPPTKPKVRLLAPFDPLVWDRRRFEHLWGWTYRFEAYTPPPQRQFGYYALPLLWGHQVIGWANIKLLDTVMHVETGFAGAPPKTAAFHRALDAELTRMERFLTARPRSAETRSTR